MYVDIWCTVSVCLCELCLFMKNVCNFELIKINKIKKIKKKKNYEGSTLSIPHYFSSSERRKSRSSAEKRSPVNRWTDRKLIKKEKL